MEKAVIMLLADTGMRAAEVASLRRDDINLDQGILWVMGKGGKRRRLALNDQPRRAIAAYLLTAGLDNGRLWPERFQRQHLRNLVYSVAKRAGVTRAFPHRFRHTFAIRFLAQTGNALALQALLGHTSLLMVQRYIAATQAEMAVDAHRLHSPLDALG
jgi:integrase